MIRRYKTIDSTTWWQRWEYVHILNKYNRPFVRTGTYVHYVCTLWTFEDKLAFFIIFQYSSNGTLEYDASSTVPVPYPIDGTPTISLREIGILCTYVLSSDAVVYLIPVLYRYGTFTRDKVLVIACNVILLLLRRILQLSAPVGVYKCWMTIDLVNLW